MLLFKPTGELDYINVGLLGVNIVMLALAAALFVYNGSLASQVQQKKSLLAQKEKEISSLKIQDVKKLSTRLKYVNIITKDFPIMDTFLLILGQTVENPVTFNAIKLSKGLTGGFTIDVTAQAENYKVVRQQMNTFFNKEQQKYLTNLTLKGFGLDKMTGKVSFAFNGGIRFGGILPSNEDILLLGTSKPDSASSSPSSP
jgi:hypothetical protein